MAGGETPIRGWPGLLFIGLPIYVLPTIIATIRKTNNLVAIILVNLLAGWTFFGWVASLVWAIVDSKKPEPPATVENNQTLE